jgi:dihydroorotate dehydrogenase
MSWCYRVILRPFLFAQDSEAIHSRTLTALRRVSGSETICEALAALYGAPPLPVDLLGLTFPNPVGLAAGMDKHAAAAPVWPSLGFGFSELGGVTLHEQPGNPAPRLFRAVADQALINRMGFNNPGAKAVAGQLTQWRALGRWPAHPIGINLGKSKITPLEQAPQDYAGSLRWLWNLADFFVINVSSPNTPNLRRLQDKAALDEILAAVQEANRDESRLAGRESAPGIASGSPKPKPILVKVAPDLSFAALDEILELAEPRSLAGIVATNTTLGRPPTTNPLCERVYQEIGGLSGKPLAARSTEIIRHLYHQTQGKLPIIGVGGIFSAADAWDKIVAGASLVQVYTGLVYEGPGLIRQIVEGLRQRLEAHGMRALSQAVGTGVPGPVPRS